ncbi:MAG: ATP-binding cassette domain-containing protein, partial [Treponema sp.]|nr:ATP-binding cassette domain-containing protein [Treponema sp.]
RVQYCAVSTLSGGEKKRLFLVRLLLTNPNFLILDEPTNDFDIFTMNILEQFLMQYQGCLLIVSHDRYFMDKVADSLFILEEDGSVSGFVGKCSEYVEYREMLSQEKAQQSRAQKNDGLKTTGINENTGDENAVSQKPLEPVKKKLSFKEQKEFESLDSEIPLLEKKKTELENVLSSGSSSGEQIVKATAEYSVLSEELEKKYERWTELAERM